jgi:hypothetical protein
VASKVSDATRQDLLQAIRERYRAGTKDDKVQILDEFIAVTGYHRKHAIRLFKAGPVTKGVSRRPGLPLYDEAVREGSLCCGRRRTGCAASG